MKTDRNRILFILGTALLLSAVLSVTLFPYLITNYLPAVVIPFEILKNVVAYLYVISIVAYSFTIGYFQKQFSVILGAFSYYLVFQLFLYLSHKQFLNLN